jgi:nucleoid DNA-binding protein
MDIPISITKEVLWQYVNIKINRLFSTFHVFSVITILITEMIKELKDGKEIKIHNLGTLSLVKTKPRMHCDITKGNAPSLSKGYKKLKFRLTPRIKKKLRRELDLDKTYGAT